MNVPRTECSKFSESVFCTQLNRLKFLRGSLSGLPPPLNVGRLRYLRICSRIDLRKNVGDSQGLKFL